MLVLIVAVGFIALVGLIGLSRSHLAYLCQFLPPLSRPAFPRRSRRTDPPADKHHPHSKKKPAWIKAEIIRLKAAMPEAGCRSIAVLCNRRYAASHKTTIGKTYVSQILRQHHYEIDILRRKLKHAAPCRVPRNFIWGVDLTGKTDTRACPETGKNGNLHSIFGIIDHGSRALLTLQALRDKTSRTLLACLLAAIQLYGKPKIIRTDNEAVFTSRLFRYTLKLLGIRHKLSQPGHPWQNGRIERLFGTLKQKLDQLTYSPRPLAGRAERGGRSRQGEREAVRAQLDRDLKTFRYWYNHVRPHQNLGGKTPAEAWNKIDPYTKPPKTVRWFEAWEGLLAGYELRY